MGSDGLLGPDLLGVTEKRDPAWLARWLKEPDQMLAEKDSIALELFARYNKLPMPNLGLNDVDVAALIDYMASASRDASAKSSESRLAGNSGDSLASSNHEIQRSQEQSQRR
jgi:protein SCO1/2